MAKMFYNIRSILLWIFIGLLSTTPVYADAPQKFSYQAVIRDADGELVSNTNIGMQISILQDSPDGTTLYSETHQAVTNDNGLISVEIGNGTPVTGSMGEINWAEGPYFIHTETDLQGGSNYTLAHTSEFQSVPYALYSAQSGPQGTTLGEIKYWDGNQWELITPGEDGQILTLDNGIPIWTTMEELTKYHLYLYVNPENSGSVTGAGEYNSNTQITITAEANEGWEFINWTGDTEHIENVDAPNTTVVMPSYNMTITANFEEEDSDTGTVTDIDGNVYETVFMVNQEWMAENLRVSRYNNEDDITTGLDNDEWLNTTDGAYAIYPYWWVDGLNSNEEVVAAYGKLYNWYAVNDDRGLCPEGWRVPTDYDWTQLVNYAEGHGYPNEKNDPEMAGNALQSCRQVGSPLGGDCDTSEHPRWDSHDTHYGFDEFGFSALPGGYRIPVGSFHAIGGYGLWWSSKEHPPTGAWSRIMYHDRGYVGSSTDHKKQGNSLRCVRDVD